MITLPKYQAMSLGEFIAHWELRMFNSFNESF